ncbi:uncharacterized protein HMPREF1120_02419 [Exophiala dermatitidis NIH/UT8656]|uniref:Uncharacterized protein n=1 Tax=Exophiala dermatitidis (strain ATCC 34100 / CBS 525.76 / NIH/UT8656) TaxID=858893 RepID=H6BSU4_EXODN|nr:uncharacterized protein HMPREF1120_02419 [Exophiala dermatitidis NIH/UT8656]EHY54248.1 hypothetical protein HMPREF1120_02419 [Exophiala dermatitidis NIH/UT8656]KAJ4639860.1 hypothetical protein HRR91_008513 [Exophiala dermatitidis]
MGRFVGVRWREKFFMVAMQEPGPDMSLFGSHRQLVCSAPSFGVLGGPMAARSPLLESLVLHKQIHRCLAGLIGLIASSISLLPCFEKERTPVEIFVDMTGWHSVPWRESFFSSAKPLYCCSEHGNAVRTSSKPHHLTTFFAGQQGMDPSARNEDDRCLRTCSSLWTLSGSDEPISSRLRSGQTRPLDSLYAEPIS